MQTEVGVRFRLSFRFRVATLGGRFRQAQLAGTSGGWKRSSLGERRWEQSSQPS